VTVCKWIIFASFPQEILNHISRGHQEDLLDLEVLHFDILGCHNLGVAAADAQ
jgi:hypothetical protein